MSRIKEIQQDIHENIINDINDSREIKKEIRQEIKREIQETLHTKMLKNVDISKTSTIRHKFAVITTIYTIATILTALFLTFYFTSIGSKRLINESAYRSALLTTNNLSVLLAKEGKNLPAIEQTIENLHKSQPKPAYAVLRDDENNIISAWYAAEKFQPLSTEIAKTSASGDGLYVFKHAFIGADGKNYTLQFANDFKVILRPIFQLYIVGLFSITIILLIFALIVWRIYRKALVEPIEHLSNKAVEILKANDLTVDIPVETNNELGQLAKILNNNNHRQRQLLNDIKNCCDSFVSINKSLEACGKSISANSATIQEQANTSNIRMNGLLTSFTAVSDQLKELNIQSEHGSTTVYEMQQVNQEVAENLTAMGESVDESISAIDQISTSIQENVVNIDQLTNTINMVGGSMQRLDSSIANEARSARETMNLAKKLSNDAATGMATIEETINGITKIQESSQKVSKTITELGQHANSIGKIIKVIEDITNQTNLLALNAAIIAAQAGEHGRGFAVVADEIAGLALRTKTSTKEIATLISSIQEAIKQAIVAMQDDKVSIENGSRLGLDAAASFAMLKDSADTSANQSQMMAEATNEQAEEVRTVSTAVQEIVEAISQINRSSHRQADEAKFMTDSANKMSQLSKQVANSSREQARSSKDVLTIISNINNKAAEVHQRQQEQTDHTQQTVVAANKINTSASEQQQAVLDLNSIIETIDMQLKELSGYLAECKF